jgi:hypothetical protein
MSEAAGNNGRRRSEIRVEEQAHHGSRKIDETSSMDLIRSCVRGCWFLNLYADLSAVLIGMGLAVCLVQVYGSLRA